jgi:hypothetical protein
MVFSHGERKRNRFINLVFGRKKVAGNGFEPLVYGLWARRDFLTTPPRYERQSPPNDIGVSFGNIVAHT